MIPEFDIFKIDQDGHLRWCASASNFDDAKAQVSVLGKSDPCEFVIFSQETRDQIRYRMSPSGAEKG